MKINRTAETEQRFLNLNPKCEPQLGKRGIYHQLGGQVDKLHHRDIELAVFWILNLSDGTNSIKEITKKSGISMEKIKTGLEILISTKLIKKIEN